MTNLHLKYKFNSWILVTVDWEIFKKFDLQDRKISLQYLSDISEKIFIWINWRAHSINIEVFDAKNKNTSIVLQEWTDWVILNNIKESNKYFSIALFIADCAAVSFSNKKWDIIWVVHSGWKWTSSWILWKLITSLQEIDDIQNFDFYILPMAWSNFEFSKKDYYHYFDDLSKKYNFDLERYFMEITDEKWYLDLRWIMQEVFSKHWLSKEKIHFSEIETNSESNNWPSYRLFTISKNILYKKDYRIVFSIEN